MSLNKLIYPAPNPSSYTNTDYLNEIIFVPRFYNQREIVFQKEKKKQKLKDFKQITSLMQPGNPRSIKDIKKNHAYESAGGNDKQTVLNPVLTKTNIPCLYLPSHTGSKKVLVYFHANAEDLGLAYPLLESIRTNARYNVLAPEYPGYGTYRETTIRAKGEKKTTISCSSEQIREDSECIYDFMISNF